MFLSRWFRSSSKPNQTSRTAKQAYRPTLGLLEDRITPSGFKSLFATPGPATHFQVIDPAYTESGKSFNVIVKALDSANRVATGYRGTAHFDLGTADPSATLPANYKFTVWDHGSHVFHVTLSAPGSQTIKVTDTITASITGSAATTVNPAPVATQLFVVAQYHMTQGLPTTVTVSALDASGHKVPNYTGTVHFSSTTDPIAVLPADYTFTAADKGKHAFKVTFKTAGTQTLNVNDSATPPLTGSATFIVDAVGPVTHFGAYSLGVGLAGFPTAVQIVALDANNRIVAGYTGTIHFTSTDGLATLPANYTFQASDNGSHVFSVTFGTSGRQKVTATDLSDGTVTGHTSVNVLPKIKPHRR